VRVIDQDGLSEHAFGERGSDGDDHAAELTGACDDERDYE
jgi:hypothetical protein